MTEIFKSILLRFVRAFVAGAVANMIVLVTFSGTTWHDLAQWVGALAFAGIAGGIGGVIMATDKYLRG